MSRVRASRLPKGSAGVVAAAALNCLALALPSPAKELMGVGVPGWSAYAAGVAARVEGALKGLARYKA